MSLILRFACDSRAQLILDRNGSFVGLDAVTKLLPVRVKLPQPAIGASQLSANFGVVVLLLHEFLVEVRGTLQQAGAESLEAVGFQLGALTHPGMKTIHGFPSQ